jgi:hypothetical protein
LLKRAAGESTMKPVARLVLPFVLALAAPIAGCAVDAQDPAEDTQITDDELKTSSFERDLAKAVQGMVLISETDAPFTPLKETIRASDSINAGLVRIKFEHSQLVQDQEMGPMRNLQIREMDFDEWFEVDPRDLADPRIDNFQKTQMRKQMALGKLLAKNLSDRHVFRFSHGEDTGAVLIFIVGRAPGNKMMGVFTVAVET